MSVQTVSRRLKLRSRGGCTYCKLQKRKCDEVKPSCIYCRQRGLICQYIDVSAPPKSQEWLEHQRQKGKRIALEIKTETTSEEGVLTASLISDHSTIRISFLLSNLFRGANMPCNGTGEDALTVQTELHFANKTETQSLTQECLEAMAMVYWGMQRHDSKMLLKGLRARGIHLLRLEAALSDGSESYSGDLVAAIALARSFEHMLPDAPHRWIAHSRGMTQLFVTMGPHAFQSPDMLRLVENNRWPMIMAAGIIRQPSLLETAAWKTVPWEVVKQKDILQRLLDVYADFPKIYQLWDCFEAAADDERLVLETQFVQELHGVINDMHYWRAVSDAEILDSVGVWDGKKKTILCPWQIAISLTRIHHAYAVALYNMMILRLSAFMRQYPTVYRLFSGPDRRGSHQLLRCPLLPIDDLEELEIVAADEIAMVIPWSMQDSLRGAGTLYMSGPATHCAIFWTQRDPVKATWFFETIAQMQSCWGSIVAADQIEPSR